MHKRYTIVIMLLWGVLLGGVVACKRSEPEDSPQVKPLPGASMTKSGIQYKFYEQNKTSRKTEKGDRISFRLLVQNHANKMLSDKDFVELPFEEDFFIAKEYFKDIFEMVSAGDSLSFWIPADSLFNKAGYLKTDKIPSGTQIKYTLKIKEIQSPEDIKKRLNQNLQVQREIDEKEIEDYLSKLTEKDPNQKFQKTDSGLRYRVVREGIGKIPQTGDTILVNYTSRLIDGKVYDYTEENTEYLVGDALPTGFDESLTLLKAGGKGVFILPSELGFGAKGMGSVVPPNAVLVFDIELVKVK